MPQLSNRLRGIRLYTIPSGLWKEVLTAHNMEFMGGFRTPGFLIRQLALTAVLLASSLLLLTLSCSSHRRQNDRPELIVAAAANLTNVSGEVGQRFTEKTGVQVIFTFGATVDLAKQIENGAPFDVFVAADVVNVERLQKQGLLTSDTPQIYARGRLVLWTATGSSLQLQSIHDLAKPEFERIAIAKPDIAPYGEAAVQCLRAAGIWDQITAKVVYGQNVAQTKQFVATGNAEAAFIPLALLKRDEGSYLEIEQKLHKPIEQAAGVVKTSAKQRPAQQFVDFLVSEEGQRILESAGYRRFP
ncbi:MAG TPA: molybdate ABC transporter substrate-binding protein [Pyrinomonadaceae bacterium]